MPPLPPLWVLLRRTTGRRPSRKGLTTHEPIEPPSTDRSHCPSPPPCPAAALHVWKTVVTNTPKTLGELLPQLMAIIIESLADPGGFQWVPNRLGVLIFSVGLRAGRLGCVVRGVGGCSCWPMTGRPGWVATRATGWLNCGRLSAHHVCPLPCRRGPAADGGALSGRAGERSWVVGGEIAVGRLPWGACKQISSCLGCASTAP